MLQGIALGLLLGACLPDTINPYQIVRKALNKANG